MKVRHFAFFVVLILLGIFVIRNSGKLGEFVLMLRHVNLGVLLLIIPVRYLYYWANSRYYVHFYRIFKRRLSFKEIYSAVVSMNFLNTVLPSGGISGATFYAHSLREKVTSRESYLAQAFWYLATFISLALVLGLSFLILFFSNAIARVSFRLILILMVGLLLTSVMVFAVSLNDTVLRRVLYILSRPANWVLRFVQQPAIGEVHVRRFVAGYHDLINLFRHNPRRAIKPFMDALTCIAVELASILIVFLAFGRVVNPGIIGAGYIFALIFSALSFFTNGVGAYEATMVAVFVALGLPFELSLSVTAVYRLFAMWLFIPYGLWFYKQQTIDRPEHS